MNRQERRSLERSNLRALRGKKVQATNKSKKLSEIKRKATKNSFLSAIVIGFILSVLFYYIKR